MKACPNCGYVPSLTNRKLRALYRKHFGAIPVWDMLERCWIDVSNRESASELKDALFRFFECESESDWNDLIAKAQEEIAEQPTSDKGITK